MFLGPLLVPTKDLHENVRDIDHQIHRVIPADDEISGGEIIVRTGPFLDDRFGDGGWFVGVEFGIDEADGSLVVDDVPAVSLCWPHPHSAFAVAFAAEAVRVGEVSRGFASCSRSPAIPPGRSVLYHRSDPLRSCHLEKVTPE